MTVCCPSWIVPIQKVRQKDILLYLLMMDLDTSETCRGWRNILSICCAWNRFSFTRFYLHSSRRVFYKSSPPFKVILVLNVVCVQNRDVSASLVTWRLFPSNCLSLRRCTLSHILPIVHLTPSLTDMPHLLTNVSNFEVWLRHVFEPRQLFGTYRLGRCLGAGFAEMVDSTGKACDVYSGVSRFES